MLFNDIQSGCEADLFQPLTAFLRAQKMGKIAPPYVPQWDIRSLRQLCTLALLWSDAGFHEEAGRLAHWLKQFESFPSLWCPEKEYQTGNFFSQLSKIDPIPGENPDFGTTLFQSPKLSAAFTLAGNGTSLGVVQSKEVEIRALGPQALPLNEPSGFGIKGRGLDGWTRCYAMPEVWLELKADCKETECKLDLRFVGLKPETPLAFVFYVKAPSCQIGQEILKPKSLRRFLGEGNQAALGKLTIASSCNHKIQIIPLAGEGCFWDTEFLVAFEMQPFISQTSFTIRDPS